MRNGEITGRRIADHVVDVPASPSPMGADEPTAPLHDRRRRDRRRPVPGSAEAELLHDLRQPLAAVLVLAETGRMAPEAPREVRQLFSCIHEQGELIRNLLDRLSSRAAPVATADLRDVVRRAVETLQLTFAGSVAVRVNCGDRCVDEVAWTRVVGNLLDNAAHAAGAGGRIEVGLSAPHGGLELAVADSGPGFGASMSRSSLGLGSVSRIVSDLGGHVELHRSRLGGALVKVVVPDG